MNPIKYIGFYDVANSNEDRTSSIPAVKKMDYIADAICRAGFTVNIISPSWIGPDSEVLISMQEKIDIKKNIAIIFTPSWKTKSKLGKKVKIIFSLLWLFFYLLFFTKKNEQIFVYHSQWLYWPIKLSKMIRRYQVVLEVEEIYSEVWKTPEYLKKWEKKLINCADQYILVSDLLEKRFKSKDKKSIVLYGAYQPKFKEEKYLLNQEYTHLVYAGAIDYVKGGAYKALDIIQNLPNNYQLHLMGDGNKSCLDQLIKRIEQINNEKNYEAVVYKGVLHGQEFTEYLLACDIALNAQNQGEYMNTAFPSKIISYLSHDLKVISTPIKSILMSKVAEYIQFSKGDSVEDFVKAITSLEDTNTRRDADIIRNLDNEFVSNVKSILLNQLDSGS